MVVESHEPIHPPPPSVESKARKWRDKLFSKEGKDSKSARDAQVDDFLASSRSNVQPLEAQSRLPPRVGVPAPRIDVSVSQRWPESSDNSAALTSSLYSLTVQENTAKSTPPPKKRVRKGLKVTFNMVPEVMGEGGDESEVPTKEISRTRGRSQSSGSTATDRSHSPSDLRSPDSMRSPNSRRNDLPPSLLVQDSGGTELDPNEQRWRPLLVQNSQDSDFLMSLGPQGRGSRLSLRESGDPNSFARRIQAKMRAEEGLALQKRISSELPPSAAQESTADAGLQENVQPLLRAPAAAPSSDSPTQDTGLDKSFWSSVISSLPDQNRPSPIQTTSSSPAPAPPRETGGYPSDLPPPYLKSPSPEPAAERPRESTQTDGSRDPKKASTARRSWRALASSVSDTALADFAACVAQFNQLFSMAAESVKPSRETSLSEWLRASIWWFLRGRAELETAIRSRPSSAGPQSPQSPSGDHSQQGFINLAKAWWINQYIVPQHPELERFGKISTDGMLAVAKTTGDQRMINLLGLHQTVLSHIRALAMSMKRNNLLPNSSDDIALMPGTDSSIWVRYPFFAPDIAAVLSGSVSRSMLVDRITRSPDIVSVMPMGDTGRHFCYGRMFVEACLSSSEDDSQQYSIACVLSITRDRTDWNVLANISSQNELVNIAIQPDKKLGPTWADVEWQVRSSSMRVRLPRGFELDVHFKESDFKTIWKIVEYTRKTEVSLQPEAGERLLMEDVLKVFQYMDTGSTKAFPPEPTQRCRVRLFEKKVTITEGTGSREAHRGYRFVAVTSPKVKTLSSVAHTLGHGAPIVFGYLRGEEGDPALLLKLREDGRDRSMLLTFHELEQRTKMHSCLMGVIPSEGELKTTEIPMRSFSMEQPGSKTAMTQAITHVQYSSPSAIIINNNPGKQEHGHSSTILSEHLRVFVNSNWGSVTDRINLGPGELKLSLDANIPAGISLIRSPQEDLTVSVAENLVPKEHAEKMAAFLTTARSTPIIRRFNFVSVSDLHKFQRAITGFRVIFDGTASMFAISRRRMVVPIYKKWEASAVRIQIVQQEKIIQLVAFFHDFSHGKCMNFVLKSTDIFESFGRSGKYGIKIVDAKFALPRTDDDAAAQFVCLDMPEYPGEHDDITIVFDSEKDRHNFQSAVPGVVREASRIGSLRK
ncbi:hypothetical protein AJ80_05858 [Polytolypa hystricis UAMH7299]|uniref:Uncharacterized protein n=1 Tax=Polytolypa hystricis (strain UAMH7299) TaxID=1447883 RepID=A0A2B7Y160_POLH7|nr:hypothetical protein AJ80_05858 [Polytolypa hystricis UAMH7299]